MNLGMMDEADVQYEAWTRSVGLGTKDEMDIKDELQLIWRLELLVWRRNIKTERIML
jgi:hypothetical protein